MPLFIYLIKNFILFLAVLGLCCCTQPFSGFREQGLLSHCGAQASHCGGFSYCGAEDLGCVGFFSSRGAEAQLPHSIWGLSPWTRDGTHSPCSGSGQS